MNIALNGLKDSPDDMTFKVFWPDDLSIDAEEELYGWKLADNWFVVAGALSQMVSLASLVQSSVGS